MFLARLRKFTYIYIYIYIYIERERERERERKLSKVVGIKGFDFTWMSESWVRTNEVGEVADPFFICPFKIVVQLETPILDQSKIRRWQDNGLVRTSTSWYWVEIWEIWSCLGKTLSWTKWKSIAICFIWEWKTECRWYRYYYDR